MTTSTNRRDTDLKQTVVEELAWDPSIDSTHIGVSVTDGSVTLSGEVDHVITLSGEGWHFQRQAAERAVRYLVGVRDVVNKIGLRTSPPARASAITSSIDKAFARSEVTDRSHGSVTCGPNGAVTVDGTVRSWDERRQCEDAAWAASGVRRVIDNLQVSLGESQKIWDIESGARPGTETAGCPLPLADTGPETASLLLTRLATRLNLRQ
jgi:osmotically-inducible protein OsmY